MQNRFYNYLYLDPTKPNIKKIKGLDIILKHEVFYVGKGTGKRIHQHKYKSSGKFMKCKIKSLKNKNIEPIILKIIDNISELEACENEKYLIKVIGRRDLGLGSLCNLNNGGIEGKGQIYSEERRKILREKNLGKKLTKEHKEKIGKSNSISLKGKISKKRKTILQLDLNNNIIKEWSCAKEISKELKINNLPRAIKNNYCEGGFKWKYKNDN